MTDTLTDHSRRTHGGLTESSLTTHDRKGREGKGREAEGRTWGDFSSCRPVTNPRTARIAMMSEAKG